MLEINYKQKLALLNASYASQSNGILPFIHKNRLTILKKGLYQKEKANYRGVGIVNEKVLLIGYYNIPYDMIIQPNNLVISEEKQKLIDTYLSKGFNITNGFPSLPIKEFEVDTEEYIIVKGKQKEQKLENDKFNNK